MMKLIKSANIILPNNLVEGSLLFSDQIEDILLPGEFRENSKFEMGLEVIDGTGMYLAPGFIDVHIHGAGGFDTMDASPEALNRISELLVKSGVTSFLPTTMTMPSASISKALTNIRQVIEQGTSGARILGTHVEGPFISPAYKGAQAEQDIVGVDQSLLEDFIDIIKIVTIAPEQTAALEYIRYLSKRGVVSAVGHSGATYQQVLTAIDCGLSHVTHLFNAMTGLHHRRPGIVGAALTTGLSCELIADFIHVHPAVINLVLKAKDPAEIILVTDQMEAGSLGDGEYTLGGQQVLVKDGAARLENGQLAGSVLTLDQAIRNIKEISALTLPEIIQMVTANPARLIGREDQLGKIVPGYQADLVLLTEDLQVDTVIIGGEVVKERI